MGIDAQQYPYIELDAWFVMPNHLHGIFIGSPAPMGKDSENRKPLGQLIGAFKTVSGKKINLLRKSPAAHFWQRRYYEHIVRNVLDLEYISSYILNNPMRWNPDQENAHADRGWSHSIEIEMEEAHGRYRNPPAEK
jgi:putative transposase